MTAAKNVKNALIACLCFSVADLLLVDLYLGPRAFAESEPPSAPNAAGAPPTESAAAAPPGMTAPATTQPTGARRDGGARSRVPRIVARFGSDEGAAYDDHLRLLATALIEDPNATILLEGHSDRRGTPEHNQSLSLERANWARRQLILFGVSASRVQTIGRGTEVPLEVVADDGGDGGADSESRRVEVRWMEN